MQQCQLFDESSIFANYSQVTTISRFEVKYLTIIFKIFPSGNEVISQLFYTL